MQIPACTCTHTDTHTHTHTKQTHTHIHSLSLSPSLKQAQLWGNSMVIPFSLNIFVVVLFPQDLLQNSSVFQVLHEKLPREIQMEPIILLSRKINATQTCLPIGSRWTGSRVGATLWTVVALATDAIVIIVCFSWGGFSRSLQCPVASTNKACSIAQTCNRGICY